MPEEALLHLAVALDGTGWHPAAWREPDAAPGDQFTARYWTKLVTEAERGQLDLVTIDDSLGMQSEGADDERTDRVRGRLDAVLVAARVAPHTSNIGLVPVAVATHTEPFHLSKAIATLDFVSTGRAGIQVRVAPSPSDARQFGRRNPEELTPENLLAEATDYVEVLRRLWDSWEDDAEIRDVATGRFVDRQKLHYIDFTGRWFTVTGPSITPRPPQGQPLVAALAHTAPALEFAAEQADIVFSTPRTADDIRATARELDGLSAAHRAHPVLRFADVLVLLESSTAAARERLARLDETYGATFRSDAAIFAGTPDELAEQLLDWQAAGAHGIRLRPARLPRDLAAITVGLVPALRARGAFRRGYEAATTRGLLGLPRPANRFAAEREVAG
jgi:alkanesulfonate monooxygenase SsuD/methylene tetrahydromethanopterin reductase-like flavin-dependent oxidoreductase (luciferase family)